MKKVFSILMVAFAMTAMVSCSKDDSNDNTGNNGGGDISALDNMAQVGSLATPLTADLVIDDFGEAAFQARYQNGDEVHVHFSAGISYGSLNKTIDLTSGQVDENFWFRYEGWAEDGCEFTHGNYPDGTLSNWLNDSEQMGSPIFANGTLTTARTDNGYSLKVEGTLIDGTSVLIKLNVPYSGEIVPLTKNSVIYDGVKYEFTTDANFDPATSNVTWSSTGDNNITSSGTAYYGSGNLVITLANNPTGDGYRFDFAINTPDIQLTYNWNNDQLTGALNGEPFTSTPFTAGEATIHTYNSELDVKVVGTLSNGKEFKLWVNSPY